MWQIFVGVSKWKIQNAWSKKGSFVLTTQMYSSINCAQFILGQVEGIGRKNVKIVLVLKDLSRRLVCGTAVESEDWSCVVSLWLDDLPVCYVLMGRICDISGPQFSHLSNVQDPSGWFCVLHTFIHEDQALRCLLYWVLAPRARQIVSLAVISVRGT